MMANHKKTAASEARRLGHTYATVKAYGYADIADLAKVVIEGNGNSPSDFFWVNIRQYVLGQLWQDESDEMMDDARSFLETRIKTKRGFGQGTVRMDGKNTLVIERPGSP